MVNLSRCRFNAAAPCHGFLSRAVLALPPHATKLPGRCYVANCVDYVALGTADFVANMLLTVGFGHVCDGFFWAAQDRHGRP